MAVLYRKYRPQTFAEVVNQKPILQTLKNQVAAGSVAHAYLFTGSRGVGKTSVARILAKAVNCPQTKDGDPCGACDVCRQIEAGAFLDLVEIDAASNTGIDNIRELIEHVKFSPSLGKYKVFIIDEVHMLSKGAFNALLKTLEEPPKHAIFILATTEIAKVPATIVSRTQRFDFKALSAADILEHLKQIAQKEQAKISDEVLQLAAQNSEGSVRDALSLLDKLMTLGDFASLADSQQLLGVTDIGTSEHLLELMANGDVGNIPGFFDQLAEKGLDYLILNRDFLEYLRKALVYKITEGKIDFSLADDSKQKLEALAEKVSANDLVFIIRLFLKSYKDLAGSPAPEIPMLLAAVEGSMRKSSKALQPEVKAVKATEAHILKKNEDSGQNLAPKASSVTLADESLNVGLVESDSTDVVLLEEAVALWPKLVEKVKGHNGPLASLLKSTKPESVDGGTIFVHVKFLFDKKTLENPKNLKLVRDLCLELYGKKISVNGLVAKEIKAEVGEAEVVMSDALKVFGGELIE